MLLVQSMFFFFQAEDGIRDIGVTGVQTCALPISDPVTAYAQSDPETPRGAPPPIAALQEELRQAGFDPGPANGRSEERRVGKECRCRWWPDHEKKKAVA